MRDDEAAFAAEVLLTISVFLTRFYVVIASSESHFPAQLFLHFYRGKLLKARNVVS
jgi:hypothetical protein